MAEGIINISEFPQVNDILPPPETMIPENSDLNNYWVSGVYGIEKGEIAATIANTPSDNSYGAKVLTMAAADADGSYSVQFFLNTRGRLWRRYKTGLTDTPSAWAEVTTQGAITANSLHAVSYDKQTLDAEKRGQALSNLGLSASNVRYTAQSLTSTEKNQVLTNLGIKTLVGSLNTTSEISASTFFSKLPLSSGAYSIFKNGKVISFYADLSGKPSDGTGTIKAAYRPAANYAIAPVYSRKSPYLPVGSVWFRSNGNINFYGADSGGYIAATWVTN